jgi:hypothetical protein
MSQPGSLRQQAEGFGQEMAGLLAGTLPRLTEPVVEIDHRENRAIIHPPASGNVRYLPLYARGQHLASIKLSVSCELDSTDRYLAVRESHFNLFAELDRAPIMRIHYVRGAGGRGDRPAAHVHVNAHRGALTHLLSQSGHGHPHDMASLHIPVGGSRFRPCLEDFIQFLINECRFDARPDWQAQVEAGRERWRRRQAATVAREVPDEVARVLRELGYTVQEPDPAPAPSAKALHSW